MKTTKIILGYYSKISISSKQLSLIENLLFEKGYNFAFDQYIKKYGTRNPYKRINNSNCVKLINALKENNKIVFIDKR